MDAFAALERVENAKAEILFCGHTHQPYIRELANGSIAVKVKNSGSKDIQKKEMNADAKNSKCRFSGRTTAWRN